MTVESIDQIKAGIDTLNRVMGSSEDHVAFMDCSDADWRQITAAHAKLPQLLAVVQSTLDHLEELERQSERHRRLSHEYQRNGEAQMSYRARLLANHEDRLRATLTENLLVSWNGVAIPEMETQK